MPTRVNIRSPYYIKDVSSSSGTSSISIYIYEGTLFTDKPSTAQYSLSKPFTQDGSDYYAVYEIAELIRDYITTEFNGTYNNEPVWVEIDGINGDVTGTATGDDSGEGLDDSSATFQTDNIAAGMVIRNTSSGNPGTGFVVSVESETKLKLTQESDLSGTADMFDSTETYEIFLRPPVFLAYDGYSHFSDGLNSTIGNVPVLLTDNTVYRPSGQSIRIPVNVDYLDQGGGWSYDTYLNGASVSTEVSGTSRSEDSATMINYISVGSLFDEIRLFRDPVISGLRTEIEQVYIEELDCNKYDEIKLTFYNKYGALQDLWFAGKHTTRLKTEQEEFKRASINLGSLSYDTYKHQHETFQKQGIEELVLNTGNVKSEYTEAIKELMLSEKVWMTKDSTVFPVRVTSSNMVERLSVNDKVFNYTVNIEYAFDKIQNIR